MFAELCKEIQFTRICENATFIHRVFVGRCCKTVADVDDDTKQEILVGERKRNDIPACRSFYGESPSAEISKLVMRLVRHYDQDQGETHGAVHWKSMGPKLRNAFLKYGSRGFSDQDWVQHIYEGSSNMRFQYCVNSQNSLLYLRAIQRTHWCEFDSAGVDGSRRCSNKWKKFLFHRGCSFNRTSILQSILISSAWGQSLRNDFSKPRKVHSQ